MLTTFELEEMKKEMINSKRWLYALHFFTAKKELMTL